MNTMHDLVSTCKQIQFNYYTKKTSRGHIAQSLWVLKNSCL